MPSELISEHAPAIFSSHLSPAPSPAALHRFRITASESLGVPWGVADGVWRQHRHAGEVPWLMGALDRRHLRVRALSQTPHPLSSRPFPSVPFPVLAASAHEETKWLRSRNRQPVARGRRVGWACGSIVLPSLQVSAIAVARELQRAALQGAQRLLPSLPFPSSHPPISPCRSNRGGRSG